MTLGSFLNFSKLWFLSIDRNQEKCLPDVVIVRIIYIHALRMFRKGNMESTDNVCDFDKVFSPFAQR